MFALRRFSVVVDGPRALKHLVRGSKKVADAVRVTMGPHGRLVAIDPFEQSNFNELSLKPEPKITKDGVTVTKAINYLSDVQDVKAGRL